MAAENHDELLQAICEESAELDNLTKHGEDQQPTLNFIFRTF